MSFLLAVFQGPDAFIWRAFAGGIGVALIAAPLGCLLTWRRITYFGDALSHGAIAGVALGFLLALQLQWAILLSFMLMGGLVSFLRQQSILPQDSLLTIVGNLGFAVGLVLISAGDLGRGHLENYLFGDILSIHLAELAWIFGGTLAVGTVLWRLWPALLLSTIHQELAQAEGVRTAYSEWLFVQLLAVVVALAIKVVGLVLLTSLLIAPAAAAYPFSRTPERMVILAAALGSLAVSGGLAGSLLWNLPSGAMIVIAASLILALSLLLRRLF